MKMLLKLIQKTAVSENASCLFAIPSHRVKHLHYLIKRQNWHHIETSQLICTANQLTGFYITTTLAFNELIKRLRKDIHLKKKKVTSSFFKVVKQFYSKLFTICFM